jgi:aryl-alcohol dehydrogenase-like predicted oxidoreductase
VTAVQSEFSLWWREREHQIIPALEEARDRVRPLQPARRGLQRRHLDQTTQFEDTGFRANNPRFQPDAPTPPPSTSSPRSRSARAPRRPRSRSRGCSKQKPWIVPIPGTSKPRRLEESIATVDRELTEDEMREIADAQLQAPRGHRYVPRLRALIDR